MMGKSGDEEEGLGPRQDRSRIGPGPHGHDAVLAPDPAPALSPHADGRLRERVHEVGRDLVRHRSEVREGRLREVGRKMGGLQPRSPLLDS